MEQTQATAKNSPKGDTVRVRARARILMDRQVDASKQVIAEVYAEPGEIIELPRREAERLAGREFEGYQVIRDAKWKFDGGKVVESGGSIVAPMPTPTVRDPIVEFVV